MELSPVGSVSPTATTVDSNPTIQIEESMQAVVKNNWDTKPMGWKIFHIILMSSCIFSPTLLISTFILIAYTNGQSMGCCSISKVIANPNASQIVITATSISACLAFFISVCRQIQIRVKYTEYNQSMNWIYANKVAVFFNCTGYFCMIMMARFDSFKYPKLHTTFSSLAFVLCEIFAIFTTVLTIKERRIEYKNNLVVYQGDKSKAFKNTFFVDSILILVLCTLSTVFLLIYIIGFYGYKSAAAQRGEDVTKTSELLPDFYNVSEWISFICLILTLVALSLGFQYDHVDDELIKYFTKCVKK